MAGVGEGGWRGRFGRTVTGTDPPDSHDRALHLPANRAPRCRWAGLSTPLQPMPWAAIEQL